MAWTDPSDVDIHLDDDDIISAAFYDKLRDDLAYLYGARWQTGDIKTTFRNTADDGWVLAYGQTVNANVGQVYNALWVYANANSLVGAGKPFSGTIGAFVLPDMRCLALVGVSNMGGVTRADAYAVSGIDGVGKATIGAATHTLSITEMPAHAHDPAPANYTGYWAGTTGGTNVPTGGGTGMGAYPEVSKGGGGAHNNMQPSFPVNYQIKL